MALRDSFERSGNVLFRYRGQVPVLLCLLALPLLIGSNRIFYLQLFLGQWQGLRIITIVLALLVSLCGLAVRAYTVSTTPKGTSGRNTSGQVAKTLNTKGIYSIVRHPLYLGNYLIWAGVLLFTMNLYVFLIISLCYWLYYERIMFAEEAYLRSQFGDKFEEWASRVPAFIPKFRLFEQGDLRFSFKTFVRREYATIFSTVFMYVLADYLMFVLIVVVNTPFSIPLVKWLRPSFYILLAALIITLAIKLVKHKTTWLKADSQRD